MADARDHLLALGRQKDALESQIAAIVDALGAPNLGGVSAPLVDAEGFPRADVDVHQTRTLRHQLAVLNTDHTALMLQVEQAMHALHADARPTGSGELRAAAAPPPFAASAAPPRPYVPPAAAAPVPASAASNGHAHLEPFALCDEVAAGSPAEEAGLQPGDRLLCFGPVHAGNHDNLRALARLVGRTADGAPIEVAVARGGGARATLTLRPRAWAGNGKLGAHLTPL